MKKENMLVSDAAKKLGVSTQTLRLGLQQGLFPFGTAIMTTGPENSKVNKPRWTYYINPKRLEVYLNGGDIYEEASNAIARCVDD
jgi:hypothetical protein